MDTQTLKSVLSGVVLCVWCFTATADTTTVPIATLPEVQIQGIGSGVVRSVSRTDIRRSGVRNAAEALDLMAGFGLRNDAASGGKVFARMGGSNVNQVIVLVDGVRYDDIGSGEADLSRIPAEWIESIAFQHGGNASGSAIGGVIAIETVVPEENSARLHAVTTTTESGVSFTQKWNHSGLSAVAAISRDQGSGRYRYRITGEDGNGAFTENLGDEFRRENNQTVRDRLFGKIEHSVAGGKVRGTIQLDRSAFGVPGYLAPRPTPEAKQDESFRVAQASYSWPTYVGDIRLTAATQQQRKEYRDPDPHSFLHESHESSERNTAGAAWRKTVSSFDFAAELRAEQERLASGVLSNDGVRQDRWLAALDISRTVDFDSVGRSGLMLTTGLNAERFGDAEPVFLPRGELSYVLTGRIPFASGVRYSQAYLAPNFYSLFWNDELLAQGNPNLRPESSEMWQGFVRTSTWSKWPTSLEVMITSNQVEDLIYWRQAFDGRWTPQNLKRASLEALTWTTRQVFVPDIASCHASIEWLEARDQSGERTTDGKYLIYRPARTVRAGIDGRWRELTGLVQVRWSARQAVLETNSKWLPDYTLVDAEIGKRIAWKNNEIETKLRYENLFDVDYRLVRHAPMPLRQIWFSASLKIGG